MSIYQDVANACRKLMNTDGAVFTEADVVAEAFQQGWGKTETKRAMKDAGQVVASYYRASKLSRFGPVDYRGTSDYARIASKIAYTGVEHGAKEFKTPNGTFKRFMYADDKIGKAGRKTGTNRDDTIPWSEQTITNGSSDSPMLVDARPLEAKIQQLEDRNRELEKELDRIRTHSAKANGKAPAKRSQPPVAKTDIQKQVQEAVAMFAGEFDERLRDLEESEAKRREIYSG